MTLARFPLLLIFVAALCAGAGCAQLSTTAGSDPERVITGTVIIPGEAPLPSDAVVLVRLIDTAAPNPVRRPVASDLPVVDRPKTDPVPQVLRKQTISGGGTSRVAFRIEYRADDTRLRHGLNLEPRDPYAGRARFRTVPFR
eukprot:gene20516-25155_t